MLTNDRRFLLTFSGGLPDASPEIVSNAEKSPSNPDISFLTVPALSSSQKSQEKNCFKIVVICIHFLLMGVKSIVLGGLFIVCMHIRMCMLRVEIL